MKKTMAHRVRSYNPSTRIYWLVVFLLCSIQHAEAQGGSLAGSGETAVYFVIIGILSLCAIGLLLIFLKRSGVLKALTTELESTRTRLKETATKLEESQKQLKSAQKEHQDVLHEAQPGVFVLDAKKRILFLNEQMKEISGLYLKKAKQQGLESAIHPEDREAYNEAWKAFTEKNEPFHHCVRLQRSKKAIAYVSIGITKLKNLKGEVERYYGWVTDISEHYKEKAAIEALNHHYRHFLSESAEGFYQLTPATPIPLNQSEEQQAKAILEMTLSYCNPDFANLYGASDDDLLGKKARELDGGCGIFTNKANTLTFIKSDFREMNLETQQQDLHGNRVHFSHQVVGIVENKKLVSILGTMRDITEYRVTLSGARNRAKFLQHVLNKLPADVQVKDTRCRFLYVSPSLASRSGIPQKEWLGKTIHDLIPSAPEQLDKKSIEVMKSGKINRNIAPFKTKKGQGWMETTQVPLVSDDKLVEGIISISMDVSDRKQHEEQLSERCQTVEKELKTRMSELEKERAEHSKCSVVLDEARRELQIQKSKLETETASLKEQIKYDEQKIKDLKENEATLCQHLTALEKQKDELEQSLKEHSEQFNKQQVVLTSTETKTKQLKEKLAAIEQALEKAREQQTSTQKALQETEKKLTKATLEHETQLNQAQADFQKLENEVKDRIEEETSAMKTELSTKQIVEKQLREESAKLEKKIKELHENSQKISKKLLHETSAREEAEEKLQNAETVIQQLSDQQKMNIDKQTAEYQKQAEELKKQLESLRTDKKSIEQQLQDQTASLNQRTQEKLDIEEQLKESEQEKAKLAEEIGTIQQAREQVEQKLNQLLNESTDKQKEHQQAESELQEATRKYQERVKELENEVTKRREELDQATKNAKELKQQLEKELEKSHETHANELSEHKAELISLQEKEEFYESMFASSAEALLVLDPKSGKIQNANPAAEAMLKIDLEKLKKSTLEALSDPKQEDETPMGEQLKTLLANAEEKGKESFQWQFSAGFSGLVLCTRITQKEEPRLLLAIRDISPLKRRAQQLKKTAKDAVEMDEKHTKLIDELKNRIEEITQTTSELQQHAGNASEEELEKLQAESQELMRSINSQSELIKVEHEALEVSNTSFDMHKLLYDTEHHYSQEAERKRLFFAVSQTPDIQQKLDGDAEKLNRILHALIEYAITHTSKGRMGLHASRKSPNDENITLELVYTGDEKEDPQLEHIFSAEDADETDADPGLLVAKKLTQVLGASITVAYRGKLTSLTLNYPCQPSVQ